jgi:hypothetical protein
MMGTAMPLKTAINSLHFSFILTQHKMRYIPQSRYTFDEIVEQCRAAINRPASVDTPQHTDLYAEVRKFYRYDDASDQVFHMKDYGSLIR